MATNIEPSIDSENANELQILNASSTGDELSTGVPSQEGRVTTPALKIAFPYMCVETRLNITNYHHVLQEQNVCH